MATISRISTDGGEVGRVFYDAGWQAYGWRTAGFTNGPYDTAEEAGEDLAAELERFRLGAMIALMLADCRAHDAGEA
jgi:hypothetical protein